MHSLDHPVVRAVESAMVGIDPIAGIVVGVSGGADSVALVHALQAATRRAKPKLVVAHLDHGLRPDSAGDATWVREYADSLGLPVVTERCDVSQFAAEKKVGVEEAARLCRYEFLSRVAAEQGCALAAVAHTADDQAETILHHLIRGTGISGLRGMPLSRPLDDVTLIRPLLQVSRTDIESFLWDVNQQFLTDETNADETYTRNRIRHVLLPLLREQFNPRVAEALSRLGEQARASHEIVEQLATKLAETAIQTREPDRIVVRVEPLRDTSRHLVREAFRVLITQQDWPRGRIGFDDWDRLADLARTSQAPKSLTLPDRLTAAYRRGLVTMQRSP